jgi:hypothetical protein
MPFLDNVEKYGTAGQVTDYKIIRHLRSACWIPTVTDVHSEYVILTAFHGKTGYTDGPQCYVIHSLPVLLINGIPT